MFDEAKTLESFYRLLSELTKSGEEKVLEVWLKEGKKISLEVVVRNNKADVPRLRLVKNCGKPSRSG